MIKKGMRKVWEFGSRPTPVKLVIPFWGFCLALGIALAALNVPVWAALPTVVVVNITVAVGMQIAYDRFGRKRIGASE